MLTTVEDEINANAVTAECATALEQWSNGLRNKPLLKTLL